MNRRTFLRTLGVTVPVFGAALGSAGLVATDQSEGPVEATEIGLALRNLPRSFAGYRIGFLSDIHLGSCVSRTVLGAAIAKLVALAPDVVLLGGDFIWYADGAMSQAALSVRAGRQCFTNNSSLAGELYAEIADSFRSVKAPDGIFAVLGNHDRWIAPLSTAKALDPWVTLLVNEAVSIRRADETLTIIGTDDLWTGVPSLHPFSDKRSPHELRIVLSHNPDFHSQTLDGSAFEYDLGLAGHTHGGQIRAPGLPAPFLNVRDRRFGVGVFHHARASVFTSRGVGTAWFPVRLNCPPEVAVIQLSQLSLTS